jgi:glucose/arabinose dehydrogenase
VGVLPIEINQPRSIQAVGPADFLTLERGSGSVLVVEDIMHDDGVADSSRVLATISGLNHGLEHTAAHLYASQSTHVYRWPYDPVTKNVTGGQEVVIENINADGHGGAPLGHQTRTKVVDENSNQLYVSVGSLQNIDPDSFRSRIRRFNLTDPSLFPIDFLTGEVFADGLRKEVGMEMDSYGVLWRVQNSSDRLNRSDLGGDIHNDNPAEEVHRFNMDGGQNYGYPFCWREYNLNFSSFPRGTAWAWRDFLSSGNTTDASCRTSYSVPVLAMQAHSAPLGITFYKY